MDITEACQLFDTVMNEKSSSIERCSTGIGNYVFIVSTHTAKYVLRCATEINAYNNTVHWLSRLQTCDIPIPKVLDVGRFENYEYLILSYTVGKDIGDIYIELTDGEKQQIFQCLVGCEAFQPVLFHPGAHPLSVSLVAYVLSCHSCAPLFVVVSFIVPHFRQKTRADRKYSALTSWGE